MTVGRSCSTPWLWSRSRTCFSWRARVRIAYQRGTFNWFIWFVWFVWFVWLESGGGAIGSSELERHNQLPGGTGQPLVKSGDFPGVPTNCADFLFESPGGGAGGARWAREDRASPTYLHVVSLRSTEFDPRAIGWRPATRRLRGGTFMRRNS